MQRIVNHLLFFCLLIGLLLPPCAFTKKYSAVFAIGGGLSFATNIQPAQHFLTPNPVTNEFFYYQQSTSTQTVGLLETFLGMEARLSRLISLQPGFDLSIPTTFDVKSNFFQGTSVPSGSSNSYYYKVSSDQLLAATKLFFNCEWYHPYLYGGIGLGFNRAFDYRANIPPFSTVTRLYSNNSETSFSYAVGLGLDVDLTRRIRLGAGYRFSNFGAVALGQAVINTTPVAGSLSQPDLYVNEVVVQLSFLI